MKKSKNFINTILALIFISSLLTITSAFADDTKITFAQIQKLIPIGTTITNAVQIMKHQGFKCSIMHGDFWDGSNVVKNVDFIECNKRAGWIVQRRDQVALIFTNNAISNIKFSTGLIGP